MFKSAFNRFILLVAVIVWPERVYSFCHELEVVERPQLRLAATASASVAIQWFGHSAFQITSSRGTRILTDPHGRDDLPWPALSISTSSRPAINTAHITISTWPRVIRWCSRDSH